MKNKIWIIILVAISNFIPLTTYAMDEFEIVFQGNRAPATHFIKEAISDPENHPFSATQLFQYSNSYKSTIHLVGNICDISEEDLEKIRQGNCVFTLSYKVDKAHFSNGKSEDIPAFILDTKQTMALFFLNDYRQVPFAKPKQLK